MGSQLNDDIQAAKELIRHRANKLEAARRIAENRERELDEAYQRLAAAYAAQRKEERCKQ